MRVIANLRQDDDTMDVIDHVPHAWYLLRDGERWLLDVNCSGGLADFSLLVALQPDEIARAQAGGHDACDAIADAIGAAPDRFRSRDADRDTHAAAHAAIMAWRRAQAMPPPP